MKTLLKKLNTLKQLNFNLFQKDFLLTWEKDYDDILSILITAEILQKFHQTKSPFKAFHDGLAISWFRDNSTRTRIAFSSACNFLGLVTQEMDEKKTQISHGETVRETANMISFLTKVIGIRDDMYPGRGNKFMREVITALDEGFKEGVLSHRPAVINLQCDLDHPTQTLSDLLHLKNYFGHLGKLYGKKFVLSWAYSPSYGKPLSVSQGLITLMTRMGMNVVMARPEGYEVQPEIIEKADKFSLMSGGSFTVTDNMKEAFKDADVVYAKSWAPYGIMTERTKLLDKGDTDGIKELEKECLKRNLQYKNWICNEELMATTNQGNALYMHCLPADIQGINCKDGEVSKEVFQYRIDTYKEAAYKPFIIAAMIMLCSLKDPISVFEENVKTF